MMALGLKPGDEVITPSFTYIATAEVIALLGLKAVFVDVNIDTYNIDPSEVRKAITDKTKAIVPVHLYGQCAEMEELLAISKEFNIPLVEGHGASHRQRLHFFEWKSSKSRHHWSCRYNFLLPLKKPWLLRRWRSNVHQRR